MIYFAHIGDEIKIGCCADMQDRIRKLKYETGIKPKILGVMVGDRKTEAALHRMFGAHLIRGREWFAVCDEITRYIANYTAAFDTKYLEPKQHKTRKAKRKQYTALEKRVGILLFRFMNQSNRIHNRREALVEYAALLRLQAIPILEEFAMNEPIEELVKWAWYMVGEVRKNPIRTWEYSG